MQKNQAKNIAPRIRPTLAAVFGGPTNALTGVFKYKGKGFKGK